MKISKTIFDDNKVVLTIEGSKGNSFNSNMLENLEQLLDEIENDDEIRGIILTGSGKTFSVGGDVFAMYEALQQGDANIYLDSVVPLIEKIIIKILQYPKPIVAAVNGAAAGAGLSLALSCDEVFAIPKAKFGMAFGGLGLSPDSGSSVIFTHHFGRKTTIKGIATARVFNSDELKDLDIINVVDTDELLDVAGTYIDECVALSPYSFAKTKLLVNHPILQQLEFNLPLEYQYIKEAATREEFKEKVNQFIDRLKK